MASCAIMYDVIMQNNRLCFKIVYNKKGIQIVGMNLTFFSSSEAKISISLNNDILHKLLVGCH